MPHETHYPILSELGINPTEALIYELLLELGPKTAQELVNPSGLGRGNVYNTLTSLKKKGLIFEESGAKTVFKAADPETLRVLAKNRLVSAQELVSQLEASLPTLKSQYQLITKKPTMRIFEGVEGMKEIYREILAERQPVYALVSADAPAPALYQWLTSQYVKQRVEKKIPALAIISSLHEEKKARELLEKGPSQLRVAALIDANAFPFQGEIDVFGNRVAFLNYREEELIGWIIESQALATTLRSSVLYGLTANGVDYKAFLSAFSSTSSSDNAGSNAKIRD